MNNLVALLVGLLFGCGLVISGMTETAKVLGFLRVFHGWDPTLLWVMGGAVTTTFVGYSLVLRRDKPLLEAEFQLPKKSDIDGRLIVGAILFGLGWGLYGYCPGPAVVSLAYLELETVAFVVAMLAGAYAIQKLPVH